MEDDPFEDDDLEYDPENPEGDDSTEVDDIPESLKFSTFIEGLESAGLEPDIESLKSIASRGSEVSIKKGSRVSEYMWRRVHPEEIRTYYIRYMHDEKVLVLERIYKNLDQGVQVNDILEFYKFEGMEGVEIRWSPDARDNDMRRRIGAHELSVHQLAKYIYNTEDQSGITRFYRRALDGYIADRAKAVIAEFFEEIPQKRLAKLARCLMRFIHKKDPSKQLVKTKTT